MEKQKSVIGCVICGNESEIFINSMPFCNKCYFQMQNGGWRDELKRNVEALEQYTSVDDVIDRVCRLNGLDLVDLMTKSRKLGIVEARQMSMYLMREKFCFTYKKIGETFNKDHATAMYAHSEIGNRIAKYKGFRSKYKELLG